MSKLILLQDEDDYSSAPLGSSKLASFTAPQAIFNDIAKKGQDLDPFADHKRQTIADRQNEYQQRMRKLLISPARVDPFADGKYIISRCFFLFVYWGKCFFVIYD